MFQYAAGRALAARLNVKLKVDVSAFDEYSLHRFSLNHLAVDLEEAGVNERLGQPRSRGLGRLTRSFGLASRITTRTYRESSFRFDPKVLTLADGAYLDGYWQSERYFLDAESLIRKHFIVRTPPSTANIEWLAKISSVKAVSMHVRRGDYASNPKTLEVHGLCTPAYYSKAVELMVERVGTDIEIFVFSDDPNWVRANLQFAYPVHIVTDNDPAHNYEDLRLMSKCRHHVIANSTFSWWGAWLNESPEKHVIAPRQWFRDPTMDDSDLIPKAWERL